MNSNHHSSVRDRILAAIDRKDVRMRSRVSFVVQLAAIVLLSVLVLLVTIFIGNFVFFILRLNGHESLLSLGSRGWGIFIRVFPWPLLILDIALSSVLVYLLRKFQFGYRTPIVVIFLVLVAVASSAGFALDKGTRINDQMLRNADRGMLPPPFGMFYEGARRPPPRGTAYRGVIRSISSDSIVISDSDSTSTLRVLLPENEKISSPLVLGEAVFVVGTQEGSSTIRAFHIHGIQDEGLPPRP